MMGEGMNEDRYVALVEWVDKKGTLIRAIMGWALHMHWIFSSDGREYLWGPGSLEPHDWPCRWWRSWEVPYPARRKGKWITCAFELYLPPLWFLTLTWRWRVALCRYRGHKRHGKDQTYMHGSCVDYEPTYTCRHCGDEWR